MGSTLDKKEVVKNDNKFAIFLVIIIIFNLWFFSNIHTRMIEFAMVADNIKYAFAKIANDNSLQEYLYHRNNAVYMATIHKKRRIQHAIKEMDKAIETVPKYVSESVLQDLYKERAFIKLYAGDKKGALDDMLRATGFNSNENLVAAALLTDRKVYDLAKKHCLNIIKENDTDISGYVCLAHVYEQTGRAGTAMKIYDYAIEKKQLKNSRLYFERALLKQRMNNFSGYEKDIEIVKTMEPAMTSNQSMMDDVINPKELNLKIKKL